MERIQNFFNGLKIVTSVKQTWKEYKEGREKDKERRGKMTAEERAKEDESKIEAYKSLCMAGLTSMYWKDTTTLLTKVHGLNATFASVLSVSFAISQGAMLLGLSATYFPKSSPWLMAVASNGALCAVLCNIAAFQLEILDFVPPTGLLICWAFLSAAFSSYWCVSCQESMLVTLLFKFVCLIIDWVKQIFWCLLVFLFRCLSYGPSDFTAVWGFHYGTHGRRRHLHV